MVPGAYLCGLRNGPGAFGSGMNAGMSPPSLMRLSIFDSAIVNHTRHTTKNCSVWALEYTFMDFLVLCQAQTFARRDGLQGTGYCMRNVDGSGFWRDMAQKTRARTSKWTAIDREYSKNNINKIKNHVAWAAEVAAVCGRGTEGPESGSSIPKRSCGGTFSSYWRRGT